MRRLSIIKNLLLYLKLNYQHLIHFLGISFIVTFLLGCTYFCTPYSAFADSVETDLSDYITVNDIIDNNYSSNSPVLDICEDIRRDYESFEINESEAVRATDYVQSIYNYLISNIYPSLVSIDGSLGSFDSLLYNYYSNTADNVADDIDMLRKAIYPASSAPAASQNIWTYLNRIYGAILDGSISIDGTTVNSVLSYIPTIHSDLTGSGGSIYDLTGVMSNNISSLLASNYGVQSSATAINSKVATLIGQNQLSWEDWSNYFTLLGVSTSIDGTYSTGIEIQGRNLYYKISPDGNNNIFGGVYIDLPTYYPNTGFYEYKLYSFIGNSPVEVDFEYYSSGRRIYLLYYPSNIGSSTFIIQQYHHDHLRNVLYNPNEMLEVKHCSDGLNQKDYFADLAIYDINHKLSELEAIRGDLNAIADEVASPDLVMAKQASTNTIDAALDDFTGSGSGSAKVSDVAGASQISSTMQSGLSSGGSISNGLSVFDTSNSGFWSWFSQENGTYFDVVLPSDLYIDIPFTLDLDYSWINPQGNVFSFRNTYITNYIDVSLFSSIYASLPQSGSYFSAAFYDSNLNFISSSYRALGNLSYVPTYFNVPLSAKYIRFTFFKDSYYSQDGCPFVKGAYKYNIQNTRSVNTSNPDAIPDFLTDIDRETYLHLGE